MTYFVIRINNYPQIWVFFFKNTKIIFWIYVYVTMNVFGRLELYWKLLKVDVHEGDINSKVGLEKNETINSVTSWSDKKCELVRTKLKQYQNKTKKV